MAIEKQFPEEVIDTTKTQDNVDSQIIDVLEAMGEGEETCRCKKTALQY